MGQPFRKPCTRSGSPSSHLIIVIFYNRTHLYSDSSIKTLNKLIRPSYSRKKNMNSISSGEHFGEGSSDDHHDKIHRWFLWALLILLSWVEDLFSFLCVVLINQSLQMLNSTFRKERFFQLCFFSDWYRGRFVSRKWRRGYGRIRRWFTTRRAPVTAFQYWYNPPITANISNLTDLMSVVWIKSRRWGWIRRLGVVEKQLMRNFRKLRCW